MTWENYFDSIRALMVILLINAPYGYTIMWLFPSRNENFTEYIRRRTKPKGKKCLIQFLQILIHIPEMTDGILEKLERLQ